jgi:hypothetical protein
MPAHLRTFIRFGTLTLALAGALYTIGIPLRGEFPSAAVDPVGFIQAASRPFWVTAWLVNLAGLILELIGPFALYAYLAPERGGVWAMYGAWVSVVGRGLLLPTYGYFLFAMPEVARLYQQGNQEVLVVVQYIGALPWALLAFIGPALLYVLGSLLFAVAIWRSPSLPRWTAIPYALQAALLTVLAALGLLPETIGAILLLVSGLSLSRAVWRQTG